MARHQVQTASLWRHSCLLCLVISTDPVVAGWRDDDPPRGDDGQECGPDAVGVSLVERRDEALVSHVDVTPHRPQLFGTPRSGNSTGPRRQPLAFVTAHTRARQAAFDAVDNVQTAAWQTVGDTIEMTSDAAQKVANIPSEFKGMLKKEFLKGILSKDPKIRATFDGFLDLYMDSNPGNKVLRVQVMTGRIVRYGVVDHPEESAAVVAVVVASLLRFVRRGNRRNSKMVPELPSAVVDSVKGRVTALIGEERADRTVAELQKELEFMDTGMNQDEREDVQRSLAKQLRLLEGDDPRGPLSKLTTHELDELMKEQISVEQDLSHRLKEDLGPHAAVGAAA